MPLPLLQHVINDGQVAELPAGDQIELRRLRAATRAWAPSGSWATTCWRNILYSGSGMV